MFQSSKTVKQLFYANFIVFIIGTLLQSVGFPLYETFALYPPSSDQFVIYQFITYMFLHSGILHIVFNMLALASFGYIVEDYMGRNKFILFYLLTGIGAALLHLLIVDDSSPMVGASGAIFAIITGFGFLFPDQKLIIFPIPIGFKAKWFSVLYFIVEVILMFTANDNIPL